MRLKNFVILGIIAVVILVGIASFLSFGKKEVKEQKPADTQTPISNMKLSSSTFIHNGMIPAKYTCDDENISPPLSTTEVPSQAQSLVLIVDDPDAPGRTFVHWTLWNIDPKIIEIPENGVPEGAQEGLTDFGKRGYGGPCPPSGTHRYFFKLYALDTRLVLPNYSQKSDIEKAMENHILAQTELVGLYSRQR